MSLVDEIKKQNDVENAFKDFFKETKNLPEGYIKVEKNQGYPDGVKVVSNDNNGPCVTKTQHDNEDDGFYDFSSIGNVQDKNGDSHLYYVHHREVGPALNMEPTLEIFEQSDDGKSVIPVEEGQKEIFDELSKRFNEVMAENQEQEN